MTAVKVFPLPSAVLVPGGHLPLHIFEPRYRALVKDALAGDRRLALAQLEPGWEADYQGRPALKALCCVGEVVWYEPLPDGRYNLVLEGRERARIVRELPPRALYREVEVQPLPQGVDIDESALRQAVLQLAARLGGEGASHFGELLAKAPKGVLADAVGASLIQDVPGRLALLEELDGAARVRHVTSEVAELLAKLTSPDPDAPLQ